MQLKGAFLKGLSAIAVAVTLAGAQTTISTASQLAQLATAVNGGNDFSGQTVTLTADIDLSGVTWTPIGNVAKNHPFNGIFDGNGKTISGLRINNPTDSAFGLFGNVAHDGEIKNLGVVDANVSGKSMVGGIVGQLIYGSITNCYFKGNVTGSGQMIGGVVGFAKGGSISKCYFDGVVTGASIGVGGVVGFVNGSRVADSYSAGTINGGSAGGVGGVLGFTGTENSSVVYSDTVTNCYSTATISGTGRAVGGVVGEGNAVNSYFNGTVSVSGTGSQIGGVVGKGSAVNSYSTGAVSGNQNVGGVVGEGSATNSYFSGTITISGAGQTVGGVVGSGDATNCYSTGTVSVTGNNSNAVGGVVGLGKATNCYSTGTVSGNQSVGGVVGVGSAVSSAALNPSVSWTALGPAGGRVSGGSGTSSSGNIAYSDMEGTFETSPYINNGADITLLEIQTDSTLKGLFTNTAVWTTEPGSLPGLFGATVPMPEHLGGTPVATLTYSAGAGGRLIGAVSQSVEIGSDGSTVVAVANDGYVFISWSDGSTAAERVDRNVTQNIKVTANFALIGSEYTLKYTAGTGGRVMGALEQVVVLGSDGTTVVALPDEGYIFVSWSDGVTRAERSDKNVTQNISVTATFALAQFTLRYSLGEGGGELIGGGAEQTVSAGSNGQEVYVTANAGYTFAMWSDGSTDNPRTDRNVQGDITVTAYFADSDGNISVKSTDRVIPQTNANDGTAIVAPVSALTAAFTAGPNPVGRQSGSVKFFRQGNQIKSGTLTVYDASGNVVNKVSISDNTVGALRATPMQPRRIVGSWDLKDTKGKMVSEGTYLVRGTVTLPDGKSERVSLVVGVR